jgi:hypothetical protein
MGSFASFMKIFEPSGVALPSHPEKMIAKVDRNLRAKKFLVFREEILKWAEDMVVETQHSK